MAIDDANAPERVMWQGKWIAAVRRGQWEYVRRPNNIRAAVILPIDGEGDERHVLLVEQYRVPCGCRMLELPAGLIGDEEGGADEDTLDAARRELEEETGYTAAHWQDCGTFHSSPGLTDESFVLLKATGLTRVAAGGGTASEEIVVHRLRLAELSARIADFRALGVGVDAKLLALLGPLMLEPAA